MPYQIARIPIGRRRERIVIQTAQTSDDGAGGQVVSKWKPLVETWAYVTPLDEREKESLRSQQVTATHSYHFAVPYTTQVTPKEQVQWRWKTLQIHTAVDDESRKRRLMLLCIEIQ